MGILRERIEISIIFIFTLADKIREIMR